MSNLKPNYDESVRFLEWWKPGGPWVLTGITLDKKSIQTATLSEGAEVKSWLEKYGVDRNIYFMVNPVRRPISRKAERENVASLDWLHVDVDPRAGEDLVAEQERALALLQSPPMGVPAPSAIVFSGGGYQGFWRLEKPLEIDGVPDKYEEAKRYNQQLELIFGADNCHNVDRIMRLPGTINRPDARKQKKGRVPKLAEIVELHDRTYPISDFQAAPPVQLSPNSGSMSGGSPNIQVSGNVQRIGDLSELPNGVSDLCKMVIAQGSDPDDPTRFPSRSEALFFVCCELVRAGCEDDLIYAIVTDPDWGISSSVLDKGSNADKYALRQIGRAREHAIDPLLLEMNDKHAVVENFGGKCRVVTEGYDSVLKRTTLTAYTFEDIRNIYLHQKVDLGTNSKGDPIRMPLGKWWLEHEQRRQYKSIVFAPGREIEDSYNLWRGFGCQALPGDCDLFLQHVRDNLCQSNEEYYKYLLGWMARLVQKPDLPGQVAVVIRGKMGTGKGFFARTLGRLFGRHYLQVSDPKHLVGSFNAHLRDCCLLFGDEAFYAGDKKHESVLKTLITEEHIAVESKGVDVETASNCIHLIMASNESWVVPVGLQDRRFFVIDVGDHKMKDSAYFGKIQDQLDHGGYEALLYYLLNYDLSDYNVRIVPQTSALLEQKTLSYSAEEEWWYSKLREGRILYEHASWATEVLNELLIADYVDYLQQFNIAKRGNATRLGQFLKKACPNLSKVQRREQVTINTRLGGQKTIARPYYYEFPTLEECRKHWDKEFGGPYDWPEAIQVKDSSQPQGEIGEVF